MFVPSPSPPSPQPVFDPSKVPKKPKRVISKKPPPQSSNKSSSSRISLKDQLMKVVLKKVNK